MVLVIVGHALQMCFVRSDGTVNPFAYELWRIIYAFHMPAFYFVSGAVSRRLIDRPVSSVAAGAISLILLADITEPLARTIHDLSQNPPASAYYIARGIALTFLTGQNYVLVPLWFLVSLAVVQVFFWGLIRGGIVTRTVTVLMTIAATALAIAFPGRALPFQAHTWLIGLIFYIAGAFGWQVLGNMSRRYAIPIAMAGFALLAVLYRLNGGCPLGLFGSCHRGNDMPFALYLVANRLGFLPITFAAAAAGVLALALVSAMAGGTRAGTWFGAIGRNSLTLLFVNSVVVVFLQPFLAPMFPANGWDWPVWIAMITAAQIAGVPLAAPAIDRLASLCRDGGMGIVGLLGHQSARPANEHPAPRLAGSVHERKDLH
jgi:fucose 4-O-acetylase-like acetyltransferase